MTNYLERIRNSKGFTLIEIMVTVGLLGLIGAIFYPGYAKARQKSIEMNRISAYEMDLNGDGRTDLVLANKKGVQEIFLRQEDGTLERLDQVYEDGIAKSKRGYNDKNSKLESELTNSVISNGVLKTSIERMAREYVFPTKP